MDRRSKTYKDLVKLTPKTDDLLSEVIDGETFTYKKIAQCKVCSASNSITKLVDTLLLYPKSYREVLEFVRPIEDEMEIDPKDRITYDSIRNHQKRHLPASKVAVREIIERRATSKDKKILEGKDGLLTAEALYEIITHKGLDDIVNDRVRPSIAQTMYAMEQLTKLEEKQQSSFRPEALINQLNTIVTAMREVLPPEMMQAVSDKIDELKRMEKNTIDAQLISGELSEAVEYDEIPDEEQNLIFI